MTTLEAALRDAVAVADRFFAGQHIPGLAYGVVAGGELVHSRGLGTLRVGEAATPDADSIFRIASMTKSFTAATILSLRDEGRLALDDPIGAHVPELAHLRGPTADAPPISIRHLLTMASGLATDDPWGDRQQGLDLAAFSELLRGPLTFAWTPGTRFEYSNLGYGILGRLITNVAGAEYREVVRERILAPLGMGSTGYLQEEVPPERLALGYVWRDDAWVTEPMDGYGALASMGGIFTSVADLARWVAFFTDAYPPRDDPEAALPLSRASRREMQTAQGSWLPDLTVHLDADLEVASGGYGFGLFVEDNARWGRLVRHSGGYPGFGSNMIWQPASGLGVIVLANHRYAWSGKLSFDLFASLAGAGVVPPRPLLPVSATAIARADVERLLAGWDDDLASRIFAMNVELDEPLALRRAAVAAVRDEHGTLAADPELPDESDTPLHAAWWLKGANGGRVKVELRLSPEARPLIQTLKVTSVPAPSGGLANLAARVVDALNAADPGAGPDLDTAPDVDRTALARAIGIAAARYAPLALGPIVGGDGTGKATWRLAGPHGNLELVVEVDAGTGLATVISLRPRPTPPPEHGD